VEVPGRVWLLAVIQDQRIGLQELLDAVVADGPAPDSKLFAAGQDQAHGFAGFQNDFLLERNRGNRHHSGLLALSHGRRWDHRAKRHAEE
jgi:hypothetical protein